MKNFMMQSWLLLLLLASAIAQEGFLPPGSKSVSLSQAIENARKLSQITFPGSRPFHLKAKIAELDSPDSDFKADVEEYWVAPGKWRRTVKTPDFSQTVIVNGEIVFEENRGDYSPLWLQNFITALFDLLPNVPGLTEFGADARVNLISNGGSCPRWQQRVGIPPAQNTVFSGICFRGTEGLLDYIFSPGYDAEFKDYQEFKDKRVARRIVMNPEPGTTIEGRVTELTELVIPDEKLFLIPSPTPEKDRIHKIRSSEDAVLQHLLGSSKIEWNPVRDGKTDGALSIYVCIDREGAVRETFALNSDNPFPADQARKELAKWHFKPFTLNGVPLQVETILTFEFHTKIANPIPVLSDAEARKLAITMPEPSFKTHKFPKGTEFTIRVAVNEEGKVMGLKNINNVDWELLGPANGALHNWRFRPYMHDGKPDRFDADITFRVP